MPGKWIRVFVPVGILRGRRWRSEQEIIVKGVHDWLAMNRLSLPPGDSEHQIKGSFFPDTITVHVRVAVLHGPGLVHVRRQQTHSDLNAVIEKALRRKLPKLLRTGADKRILFLERQHMNLDPRSIIDAIEAYRPSFPELAQIEIWIVETPFYVKAFGGKYLHFERYENGAFVESLESLGESAGQASGKLQDEP